MTRPGDGRRRGRGFTFIEMLIAVAILAVLATVAVPTVELSVQRSREQELRTALRHLREAIDAYKRATDEGMVQKNADETGYPKRLEDLVEGTPDLRDAAKRKIYFLRRLPADPMADPDLEPARSWGKRSYASSADSPREGADVFDVFSLSTQKGLNGVPYNRW
jgi:general secretion pathway protein G